MLFRVIVLCVLFCCYRCLLIVFFKQKTAYEWRISDWSSDVCSSDLLRPPGMTYRRSRLGSNPGNGSGGSTRKSWDSAGIRTMNSCSGALRLEIGRASCRERVCQYV